LPAGIASGTAGLSAFRVAGFLSAHASSRRREPVEAEKISFAACTQWHIADPVERQKAHNQQWNRPECRQVQTDRASGGKPPGSSASQSAAHGAWRIGHGAWTMGRRALRMATGVESARCVRDRGARRSPSSNGSTAGGVTGWICGPSTTAHWQTTPPWLPASTPKPAPVPSDRQRPGRAAAAPQQGQGRTAPVPHA